MPTTLEAAISQAVKALQFRSARIATTENARAFNDEHGAAGDELAASLPDSELRRFANLWDATLDSGTCAVCEDHDGEIAVIGQEFEDSDEPGEVHPGCRCLEMAVLLDAPMDDDAFDRQSALNELD